MTPKIVFTPVAKLEVLAAQEWYEREGHGLGKRFADEMDRQIMRILINALQFPVMLHDVRRARLRIFPYGLFFWPVNDEIIVIACFHSSRDPLNWQRRI